MRFCSFVLLAVSTFCTPLFAADVDGLVNLFEREFVTGYDDGKCQYNTRYFTAKARAEGINLSGALYLTIQGYGDIWYYHGRSRPGRAPDSGIWFHHYVLIVPTDGSRSAKFSPDRGYAVLDFDFGNSPELVDLRTYLREMFMPKYAREDESKVPKSIELGFLKLTAHNVSKLVDQLESNGEFPRGAEAAAAQFEEVRFLDLYPKLPVAN